MYANRRTHERTARTMMTLFFWWLMRERVTRAFEGVEEVEEEKELLLLLLLPSLSSWLLLWFVFALVREDWNDAAFEE